VLPDGLYLVVDDIEAARAELIEHGAQVSQVFHGAGRVFHRAGTTARGPGHDPERTSYASFASFSDPDENGWLLQEVADRLDSVIRWIARRQFSPTRRCGGRRSIG
jgi:hypothetical protein